MNNKQKTQLTTEDLFIQVMLEKLIKMVISQLQVELNNSLLLQVDKM